MNRLTLFFASAAIVGGVALVGCSKKAPTAEQQCSAQTTYDQIVAMLAQQIAEARDDNADPDTITASSVRALKSVITFELPTVSDVNASTHKISCDAVVRLATNGQPILIPRTLETNEVAADHVDLKVTYSLQPAADDGRTILQLDQAGNVASAVLSASLNAVRRIHGASVPAPPSAAPNDVQATPPNWDDLSPKAPNSGDSANAAPVETTEEAKAFAVEYFRQSSGAPDDALAWLSQHYADAVNFFGTQAQRGAILKQKADYLRRWPIRLYSVEPGSVAAQCDQNSFCRVSGIIDWSTSSDERDASADGKASFEIATVRHDSEPVIVAENSRVIARVSK